VLIQRVVVTKSNYVATTTEYASQIIHLI